MGAVSRSYVLRLLGEALRDKEVSWVVTDRANYGWEDINPRRDEFLKRLGSDGFTKVWYRVYDPKEGSFYTFEYFVGGQPSKAE
ncbi:MAG TPA: hypothetical protein VKV31_01870 [bacterium]|nr:hypothetical protein [bacterium]